MSFPMSVNEQHSVETSMPSIGSMMEMRLPQPGSRPISFRGTELAMAMSFTPNLPYWYEVNIYRTEDQRFVVAIRLFFQSEELPDRVKGWAFNSLDAALSHIEEYDAGNDVVLPGANLLEMSPADLAAQAMFLKAEIASARAHYGGLIGELFCEIEAVGGTNL